MNISQIKKSNFKELKEISSKIREFLISSISKTGGHIGANLSTIEITIALHKVFNSPKDKFIFDTGHQGYTHKILTGRINKFPSLNQNGGMSRFLKREESKHDIIDASHAGTALSIASGFAWSRKKTKDKNYVIPIVGDGTMVEGMNFEALNFSSVELNNMIIILNDNEMAIDQSVGGFRSLTTGKNWKLKTKNFFQGLNLDYISVQDGHNIQLIIKALRDAKKSKKTCVVHIKTEKGRGLKIAKKHKYKMHFSMPFNSETGEGASPTITGQTFGMIAAKEINKILNKNKKAIVVTPATPYASYLDEIEQKNQDRVVDVGMAEQHAVGFACGLALRGYKPVLCVQSTFLQRAYDQIIHELSFMSADVLILSVRSGFAGFDSPTHHGLFDISYLNSIPNINIFYPNSEKNLKNLIQRKMSKKNSQTNVILMPYEPIKITDNNNEELKNLKNNDKNLIIFCLLNTLKIANDIKNNNKLKHFNEVKIFCLDQIKPFNQNEFLKVIKNNSKSSFISIEENMFNGGLGSIINQNLNIKKIDFVNFAINDKFIDAGDKEKCLKESGIDSKKIISVLNNKINEKKN